MHRIDSGVTSPRKPTGEDGTPSILATPPSRKPRDLQRFLVRERLSSELAEMHPGDRLPTEPDLARHFEVSRATLREALRYFEEAGVLTRVPGAGTFVRRKPALHNDLAVNAGVTQLIRANGMEAGARETDVRAEPAPSETASRLQLRVGAQVLVVDRTHTADGQPVVVSTDIVSARLLPEAEEVLARLEDGTSLHTLLFEHGVTVNHGVASIRPLAADATVARRLEVKTGVMLLCFVQVDYDSLGLPKMLSYEYHLPDVIEVTVLRRNLPRG